MIAPMRIPLLDVGSFRTIRARRLPETPSAANTPTTRVVAIPRTAPRLVVNPPLFELVAIVPPLHTRGCIPFGGSWSPAGGPRALGRRRAGGLPVPGARAGVAGAASRGRRGRGRHRHRMRVHSPGGLTVSPWVRLVREEGFEAASVPVQRPRSQSCWYRDLRFRSTRRNRSCPLGSAGGRCGADPARTEHRAGSRLRAAMSGLAPRPHRTA